MMWQSASWYTQPSHQKIHEDIGGYGPCGFWHKICNDVFFEKCRTCYFSYLSNTFTKYSSKWYMATNEVNLLDWVMVHLDKTKFKRHDFCWLVSVDLLASTVSVYNSEVAALLIHGK